MQIRMAYNNPLRYNPWLHFNLLGIAAIRQIIYGNPSDGLEGAEMYVRVVNISMLMRKLRHYLN